MQDQNPSGSTQFSFPMSKCAIALLCCAFLIEPLFAQTLNWPYNGADVYNSRFQNIDQINPSNVSQLKPAWTFHTGVFDSNMTMEMTPLVINGVMYITTGDDDVFALNPTSGAQIWHYKPTDMPKISTLPICCNNDNRGVAYGMGLIFNARLDAKLVALNAKTGAVAWETAVDLPGNMASMTLAPQFIGASMGTIPEVIVGVSGSDYGVRGHLDAYNPATGKLLWRFWTTDPATFAGDSWKTGGASIWGTPTFDPTLNMVYFSTGNAWPDFYAINRAGTNLFAASIVALDATSGELQWFFQEAHHDMWDYDGPQPTLLFSYNGVPAIEHTNKTGYMWILDRASGEPLIPYQEVAVPPTPANAAFQHPWPTQPVSSIQSLIGHEVTEPVGAGQVAAPMWSTLGPTTQVIQPFFWGGMEWPPAAYSPRTRMIYSHSRYKPVAWGQTSDNTNNTYEAPPGVSHGVYGAVNPTTGTVAWTIPVLTTPPDSGMTVAGDLVFFADCSGLFYAANAATGEVLWVFDAYTEPNAGGGNGAAAVYEVNGVEYVVYGFGGKPGESFTLGDLVIAFALPSATAAAAAKAKAK
jgi:quinohemoprotein ethanol dehydrogenase